MALLLLLEPPLDREPPMPPLLSRRAEYVNDRFVAAEFDMNKHRLCFSNGVPHRYQVNVRYSYICEEPRYLTGTPLPEGPR